MRKLLAIVASGVFLASFGESAHAFTYAEGTDPTAAPLVADAVQITPTNATADGNLDLTNLTGSASGTAADATPEADLFGIFLTGGTTFTATPVQAIQGTDFLSLSDYNIQLFLFNASESGVAAVDGGANGSAELAPLSYVVPTSGVYYLGISGYDFDPTATLVNGNSFIFPNTNEPVNNNPLSGWAGYTGTPQGGVAAGVFNYDINLTNAQPVPEPAVGGSLLAVAGLGALSARRRAKQAQKA